MYTETVQPAFLHTSSTLTKLMHADPDRMKILETVSSFNEPELWIAGGFVRNLVWEEHNKDIDVFYYDSESIIDKSIENIKQDENIIRDNLNAKLNGVSWSVRNQARMHINNNESQYSSLFDAMVKQTDTASSTAMRLLNGEIFLIRPYSLYDLIHKIINPTPHFNHPQKIERFFQRVIEKNWFENEEITMLDPVRIQFEHYYCSTEA